MYADAAGAAAQAATTFRFRAADGEDLHILIDMLLLARCDALIMTRTRFTSYALVSTRYFNGNVQKVEDLHRELAAP